MVRYLHKDFSPIRAHLAAGPADVRRLEWELNPVVKDPFAVFALKPKRRAAAPPQAAGLEEIEAVFRQSSDTKAVGSVLAAYFHINAPPSNRPVSLAAAIEHVEAFGAADEFLLAGHPEGGLVSVSRRPLPFQDGLELLRSWAPDTWWGG